MHSRRDALSFGLAALGGLAASDVEAQSTSRTRAVSAGSDPHRVADGGRRADQGNGTFLNPVLSGDRPDPNILKDGEDYYATFSSFLYFPAVVVWHSRDLINWQPIGPALAKPLGSVWALDIAKHRDRYFIYIPVFNAIDPAFKTDGMPCKIFVVHADSMHGPWSEPIDMDINGYIDPGHAVGEDGQRYIFLNGGARVRISADGLRRAGPIEHVYDGWPIPADWVVEAPALEGPKVLRRAGWYYLFSGEGGTAGPPTSHMVIVARSRSIDGPWENCPRNPIVHTRSAEEPWWSRGHGTPVQGPSGDWWLAYHGYENGLRTLGRQMLLEPFEWAADGWPRMLGGDLSRPLPKPGPSVRTGAVSPAVPSRFDAAAIGTSLAFYDPAPGYLERARFSDGAMRLSAQGNGPGSSSPIAFVAGDRSYEVTIDVEVEDGTQGGLLLFYNDHLFCGLGVERDKVHTYKVGQEQGYPPPGPARGRRFSLRVVNDENVASFHVRDETAAWRLVVSYEVTGYNHNMADGFMSLRPAFFAAGRGAATFRHPVYRARTAAQIDTDRR